MSGTNILEFPDAEAWDAWLTEHHASAGEAWLRVRKRHADVALPLVVETLDVALCHGWIDGHRRGYDDVSFLQRYSPRRRGSSWSRVNVAKAEALIAAGRMRPAGLAEIEAARADGRWAAAYASQREAEVPAELARVLAGDDRARAAFERLGRSERYALILPLLKSRTPQARSRIAARTAERLAAGEPPADRTPED